MSDSIRFEIVTPVRAVYSGELSSVTLPSTRGELEILPDHRALLALVTHGTVVATEKSGTTKRFVVQPGYVETADDKVTLLVAGSQTAEEIDLQAARKAVKESEEALSAPHLLSPEVLAQTQENYARARAQVAFLEKA